MICQSVSELIGHTPMLRLCRLEKEENLSCKLIAKLEAFNPAGSAKDRIAREMLDDAERRGLLDENTLIVEPTSGNTGIGLAAVAASRGYKLVLTMPDTMSMERRQLLAAYGAEIVLTPGAEGMAGAVKRANEIAAEAGKAFIPSQFDNPANPRAHYLTTGREIREDCPDLAAFVATIGTGGTLTGTGRYLKETGGVYLAGVEPASSPLLTEGHAGPHKIQGIGANFIPSVFDRSLPDEILTVTDEDAYRYARLLVRTEGFLAGISSGAALCAAVRLGRREAFAGKTIVALLPDTGERYLSAGVF